MLVAPRPARGAGGPGSRPSTMVPCSELNAAPGAVRAVVNVHRSDSIVRRPWLAVAGARAPRPKGAAQHRGDPPPGPPAAPWRPRIRR